MHLLGLTLGAAVVTVASVFCPAAAAAQDHAMQGVTMGGGWRMVPMDPNMLILPGLEDAVPVVGAFVPGMGIDPSTLPEARPSELVRMGDGDTLDITISMVRRK